MKRGQLGPGGPARLRQRFLLPGEAPRGQGRAPVRACRLPAGRRLRAPGDAENLGTLLLRAGSGVRTSGWMGARYSGTSAERSCRGRQPIPVQDLESAGGRDHQASPHGQGELGGDPPGTETGMSEGECDHPLLEPRRHLVGIRGRRRSRGAPGLELVPPDPGALTVAPGAAGGELPAGSADPHLARTNKCRRTLLFVAANRRSIAPDGRSALSGLSDGPSRPARP